MIHKKHYSVLYVPGVNERAMKKASSFPSDAIIFDLEDSVSAEQKERARTLVRKSLSECDYGERSVVVRINRLDTAWGEDDIKSMIGANIDALCVPKVESAKELEFLRSALEIQFKLKMPIWAMIETPKGVLDIVDITSVRGLEAIVMGTTDLSHELGLKNRSGGKRSGLHFSLSQCVLAAKSVGIKIFDGVCLDLTDIEGFKAQCEEAKELGFDGKTLIHPSQIEIANDLFGPSPEDIARARRIILAWEEATAMGKAVAVVDDQLIESMHVQEAKQLVELHS
ncbi:MAG: CoA ester lyase [Halieaceae bacterium]|nr:CoA ester lyase [Halieaceae bacterium]